MALGFFRKRQKMIFIIMVVLMVSFLIGYQGFQMLFQKSPAKTVLGETKNFKVTLGMQNQARSDLEILQWLARGFGRHTFPGAAFDALLYNTPSDVDRATIYTILFHQATEDDYDVTEAEVDNLIRQMKTNGMDFDAYAMHMRQNRGIPVKQIRGVLSRWLLVCKACRADQVVLPPSREQLVQLFRDAVEKMSLRIITIPAKDFIKGVGEPTKEQIAELFEANKNRPPKTFSGLDSFSFGYLLPARVKLAYLFVSENAVLRSAVPSDSEIADYIRKNDASLTKTVGEGDKAKTVPLSYTEKRVKAINALQPELAQAKFTAILEQVRQLTDQQKTPARQQPENVYADAVKQLTLPANDLLDRKVPVLALDKLPLDKAVDMLAQSASPRISAICFPYGQHGKVKIAPDLKISLHAANITVGEALEKIAGQIPDMPKLTWGMYEGIDNVLFPVAGVRLFPVTAYTTGLDTQEQLRETPILRKCYSRQPPASLVQLAMQVKTIQPKSPFQVNQPGPALQVWDPDNAGAVLWRVIAAEPAHSPKTLTDEIRQQVVRDWKLQQAFPAAKVKAESIQNAADMQSYIKANKSDIVDTGMFARKTQRNVQGVFALQPTRLTAMNFLAPAVDAEVVQKAFATLAPKNLSADYPRESENVLVLPLPCEGYVLVARRVDFEPAEKKMFEEAKPGLIRFITQQQKDLGVLLWFKPENVKQRTGYAKKENVEE